MQQVQQDANIRILKALMVARDAGKKKKRNAGTISVQTKKSSKEAAEHCGTFSGERMSPSWRHILASTIMNSGIHTAIQLNRWISQHKYAALVDGIYVSYVPGSDAHSLYDQVIHPIHDQSFYLTLEHKRKLKDEFGICWNWWLFPLNSIQWWT